ncbi:MAG: replicative DNA helicase, partial [Clostridia bacterium]|nr:replicative DNA helicase [Clostridia bacterium]
MELTDIRRIPQNVEAEQCVIGSILIDPSCINQIADKLTPEHFYVEQYAQIYEIMFGMFLGNKSIDFVTVLDAVKSKGIYDENEGKRVLFEMTQLVPSTKNIAEYAKIIVEKSSLRKLIDACADITSM